MPLVDATALLLLAGMGQVGPEICLDPSRAQQFEGQEIEISIEIVALSVDGPFEARQIGCEKPLTILVDGKNAIDVAETDSGVVDLVGYKIEHAKDRVMATVKGRAEVLPHPPSSDLPDAITLFVDSVSATWSEPDQN